MHHLNTAKITGKPSLNYCLPGNLRQVASDRGYQALATQQLLHVFVQKGYTNRLGDEKIADDQEVSDSNSL